MSMRTRNSRPGAEIAGLRFFPTSAMLSPVLEGRRIAPLFPIAGFQPVCAVTPTAPGGSLPAAGKSGEESPNTKGRDAA